MATKLAEVLEFIHTGMSTKDRQVIIQALNDQQKLANMRATMELYPGVTVEWNSSRIGGRVVRGTVKKVNRTTVHVFDDVQQVTWRVSPTLLRVVPR